MSKHVATYVEEEQHERWAQHADSMGMSMSEWVQAMVEAGLKKFSRAPASDKTRDELRQQCNDLRSELTHARNRIQTLESQVYASEGNTIVEYVKNNPGTEYPNVVQHVINTANSRVAKILDRLDGDELDIDEHGRMYVQ
ncbi:hypothetical protein [Haloarchaeobius sp. HME9146]|uniref:hypothetical protein n=1 Tax=Haloarchaeobius sp. HME9146 TaxID=2978732 RepID=UPI0021BEB6E0|nr:hypothetical protein [Haloarchaeobius sp. HME9146]MCT9096958.1 hypothetical protein [Haloarchaeobius sp. HME9146]